MGIFPSRNFRTYWPVLVIALLFGEVFTETPVTIALTLGLATSFWLVAILNLGGFTTLNGICVALFGVSEMLIPRVAKIAYGQPAESRLLSPALYYDVLLAGCFLLFLISWFFKPSADQSGATDKWVFSDRELKIFSWLGCFWVLFSQVIVSSNLVTGSSQLAGIFAYADSIKYFGFCCAIAYRIRKTGGSSNLNALIVFYGGFLTLSGVFGFWKEAMLTPPLLFILVSFIHQFRWRKIHILVFACFAVLYVSIISPAATLGHSWVASRYGVDPDIAVKALFADLIENPGLLINAAESLDDQENSDEVDGDYYGHGQNFLLRITTVGVADLLLNYTEKNHFFGMEPMFDSISIVPRSVRGAASFNMGNFLAREIGVLGPEDFTTGIAFSFFSTAYALDGWTSLFMLSCSMIPLFFLDKQ